MLVNNFPQRKKDVLSKKDKSSKNDWDKKIKSLCKKINSFENYYTTSSCSGRIVLMIDKKKKAPKLFQFMSHDLIDFEELKKNLNKIIKLHSQVCDISKKQLTEKNHIKSKEQLNTPKQKISDILLTASDNFRAKQRQIIKFKQEPCILHVACETLKDAEELYKKAKLSGWKRSGIISSGKRFVVELNSTEKLEFPIINKNKIIVSDEFLKLIVKKSNENLKKSWGKIGKLKSSLN